MRAIVVSSTLGEGADAPLIAEAFVRSVRRHMAGVSEIVVAPAGAPLPADRALHFPAGTILLGEVHGPDDSNVAHVERLDAFGLVPRNAPGLSTVQIEALNEILAQSDALELYAEYKRSLAEAALAGIAEVRSEELEAAAARWNALPRRPRFIVHAGTSKTGTTALQRILYDARASLAQQGTWYPPNVDPGNPKHQTIVRHLREGDVRAFGRYVEAVLAETPDTTQTVVLSAEGIANHWWDFPAISKAALERFARAFDVELWLCFRDPESYLVSLCAQLIRNPPALLVEGKDLGLGEMLEDPWFTRHADYLGLTYQMRGVFGAQTIRAFEYAPGEAQSIAARIGVSEPVAAPALNAALRAAGVALTRIVNRYPLEVAERARVVASIEQIDAIIGERSPPFLASDAERRRIRQLTSRDWRLLRPALEKAGPSAAPR